MVNGMAKDSSADDATPDPDSVGHATTDTGDPMGRNRWVIAAAVAIPVILVGGVLYGASQVYNSTGESQDDPLNAVTVPNPDGESPECSEFLAALGDDLGEAKRVEFTDPAPEAAAGYRLESGAPVIIRCGLPAPQGFEVGTSLTEVNDVQWFNEADPVAEVTDSTWVAVDRPVYVAITLPEDSGTGPIQAVSDTLKETMEATEPAPAEISTDGAAPAEPGN